LNDLFLLLLEIFLFFGWDISDTLLRHFSLFSPKHFSLLPFAGTFSLLTFLVFLGLALLGPGDALK
jgi:hypothetical protein